MVVIHSATMPRVVLGDRTRLLLAVIGSAMVAAGYFSPGKQAVAVTTLIGGGAGLMAVALLLPYLKSFELGPLKTTILERGESPGLVFQANDEELARFAYFVLGDQE